MRSLVTGGTGFLGSRIVGLLLERGDEVVIFSRRQSDDCLVADMATPYWKEAETLGRIRIVCGDVLDTDAVIDAAQGCDRIFHFSGTIWGSVATEVMGTRAVIQAATTTGAGIIYASTSNIYGRLNVNDPAREDQAVEPLSDYGIAKHYCEGLLVKAANERNIDSIILRFFNPFGPGQNEKMSVPRFFRAALADMPITIYGSGNQTRDYVFVTDSAEMAVSLADKFSGCEIFNVGSGTETSIVDIVTQILQITSSKSTISHQEIPGDRCYLEVDRRYASLDKLKQRHCFFHRYSLQTGLEIMHDYFCRQNRSV